MTSIATLIFPSTVLPRKTVTKEPQYIHVYSTNSILFQFVCSILGFIFISVAVLMKKNTFVILELYKQTLIQVSEPFWAKVIN